MAKKEFISNQKIVSNNQSVSGNSELASGEVFKPNKDVRKELAQKDFQELPGNVTGISKRYFANAKTSGHKNTYIQEPNLARTNLIDIAGRGTVAEVKREDIPDMFRRELKGYWVLWEGGDEEGPTLEHATQVDESPDKFLVAYETPEYTQEGNFPVIKQTIRLSAVKENTFMQTQGAWDPNKWQTLINDISSSVSGELFYDKTFESRIAYDTTQFGGRTLTPGGFWANVVAEYEYYDSEYEDIVESRNLNEKFIPVGFFLFGEAIPFTESDEGDKKPQPEKSDDIMKVLTLNGKIPPNDVPQNVKKKEDPRQLIAEKGERTINADSENPLKKYYKNYVEKVEEGEDSDIADKNSNLLYSSTAYQSLLERAESKTSFPMHIDVSFNTEQAIEFGEVLSNSDLGLALPLYFLQRKTEQTQNKLDFIEYQSNLANDVIFQQTPKKIDSIDLDEWYSDFLQSFELYDWPLIEENSTIMVSSNSDELKILKDEVGKFKKTLLLTVLRAKIKNIIDSKLRTPKKIFADQNSYYETIFYEIIRYRINDNGAEEKQQTIYLVNNNDIDVFEYVDTQVRYNKEYNYKINSVGVVFGNEYEYEKVEILGDPNTGLAEVVVKTKPSIELVSVPYYEENAFMFDKPPVPPEIVFDTFRNINDKLLIRLRQNAGDFFDKPIAFNDREQEEFNKIAKNQKLFVGGPIQFASDDYIKQYEVYRLDRMPKSYLDFSNCRKRRLDVRRGTAFIDNIEPNVEYYYIARSIDFHSHYSNPTEIYKIKLVEDSDINYLILDVVDITKQPPKKASKKGRKYLYISPSLQQSMINLKDSKLTNASSAKNKKPKLGVRRETIFGKNLKVRIKSIHTGKIFDINYNISKEHINEE